jgi:hypothetical protein
MGVGCSDIFFSEYSGAVMIMLQWSQVTGCNDILSQHLRLVFLPTPPLPNFTGCTLLFNRDEFSVSVTEIGTKDAS